MTKKAMKNKIFEIQKMSDKELAVLKTQIAVSDLEVFKKELLFKAIDIRENSHLEISNALVELEELKEGDEDEL